MEARIAAPEPAEPKREVAKTAEVALPVVAPALEATKTVAPASETAKAVATEPDTPKPQPAAPEPAFKEPKRLAVALENPKFKARPSKSAPLPAQEMATVTASPSEPAQALNSVLQYATPTFVVAPAQDHTTAILRKMKPAVSAQQPRMVNGAPQLTLPGPSLPPQLNSVTEGLTFGGAPAKTPAAPAPAVKKPAPSAAPTTLVAAVQGPPSKLRGWLVSLSVMTALLTAGGAAIYWALPPQTLAKVKPGKAEPETTPAVESPSAASTPPSPSNSLARQIEVTGIRFVAPANKKPEIHYLVVNHSAVALNDVTVYVTLHMGSAKPGEPPLSRFSFRAPNIAAFESKEMTSAIEKVARELTFPEWQDVRADISIGK
jgi:hypothetical protein